MKLPRYQPMLAGKRPAPFDDPGWVFEPKLDGIRGLWSWDEERVELRSRSGRLVNETYPELMSFRPPKPCVLDGEIIAFGDEGSPSFGRLQRRMNTSTGDRTVPVAFVVFDVLFWGEEVTGLPLWRRREILEQIDLPSPFVRSEQIRGDGVALYDAIVDHDLEGIVAKKRDAPYVTGHRTDSWLKIMHRKTMRAVVGGYLPGTGWREQTFGSLALGLWHDGMLQYVGNVGSGFSDSAVQAIAEALGEMGQEDSPFAPDPTLPPETVFVAPHLVAHVEYANWTGDGHLRAPVFKGFGAEPHLSISWETEGPTS